MFLDPIRFRYSTESIVDEPEVTEELVPEEAQEPKQPHKSRRRRGKSGKPKSTEVENPAAAEAPKEVEPKPQKAKQPKPKAESKPKTEKSAEPQKAAEGEAKPHKPRRRSNYRRHKPKASGESKQSQ